VWLSLFLCVNNFSLMNHPIPCERGLVLGFGPNKILHSRSIFFEDEIEHSTQHRTPRFIQKQKMRGIKSASREA
jgi:hypothetical protein